MRITAALLLILCLSWPGFAVQSKKRRSSHPATATTSASKKPAAKGTTKKGRRTTASRRRAPRKPAGQTAPTSERYQEIQQALVAKGYGPHAPDGVWGPEWSSALKRFQQDQKLEATGKLNSLSLITLGLGPKRDQASVPAVPNQAAPAGTAAPVVPTQPATTTAVPNREQPAGATTPPATLSDQPSSSSSTVREQK